MARTAQLGLPLVMPAQAQKHVTVNEALARLDAAAQLRVVSSLVATPPAGAGDGGWTYLEPRAGWQAWDESQQSRRLFDGTGWMSDAVVASPGGAGTAWKIIEFDHVIAPGGSNVTAVSIPNQAQVLGVTGRVMAALAGPGLTGWRVGVAGSDNRYASGLGVALNSYLVGLSGSPVTYYAPTPLVVTAEGGSFASGQIRLALHVAYLIPPRSV
jgi:hypothetical protein